MEGRRRISRVSSASLLASDRRRSFDAGSNPIRRSRAMSASSYKTYYRNDLLISDRHRSSFKPNFQKWTGTNLDLSPNIRRAIAIAAKQAYKNIQQAFYGDPSAEKADAIKKENHEDLMLDKFLENIRRVKTSEPSAKLRTVHSRLPGSAMVNNDRDFIDNEDRNDLILDTLIAKVKRAKAGGPSRELESERHRRPGSASVNREPPTKECNSKPLNLKRQGGITTYDIADTYDTADSLVERRERIRNRSMNIEKHVMEARERIRKAKTLRDAEIQAITAALESNQIDQERIRDDAVQTAKQRLWRWRAQHRGDDSDPVYKYKTTK